MRRRRRDDGIAAVFASGLRRAAETAEIAFGDTDVPILYDWRLRECDFGARNGSAGPEVEVKADRVDYCDRPYRRISSKLQLSETMTPVHGPTPQLGVEPLSDAQGRSALDSRRKEYDSAHR